MLDAFLHARIVERRWRGVPARARAVLYRGLACARAGLALAGPWGWRARFADVLRKEGGWRGLWGAWVYAQSGRFALFLPVCLGAGVLAYFSGADEPGLVWPGLVLAVCAALAVLWRGRPMLLLLALAGLSAALGFGAGVMASRRALPWNTWPASALVLEGRVEALEYLVQGRRVRLGALRVEGAPVARDVRVRLWRGEQAEIHEGDVLRLRALVRPPPLPDIPGGRDVQREAYFSGLGGYGYALGPVEVRQRAPPSVWRGLRMAVAARAMAALGGDRGAIAATLLSGEGSAISTQTRADFAASGLAHLLAVAGLHVGIVMGLVLACMRAGLRASEFLLLHVNAGRVAGLAALAAGFGYLLLTGGHLPIWRSFVMAVLVAGAGLAGRQAISMRGLAVAGFVMLLMQPWQILGASFQMSFGAVLALAAGWEWLRPQLAHLRGAGREIAALALTSLLAGLASMPFAAFHFGRVGLYFVPANMVAVPLTAVWVMPWGLAALALMPLGLQGLAFAPMGWGIAGLMAIAHGVAGWPAASLAVPMMPGWGLACVALGLIWLCLWHGWVRLAGVALLLAGPASPSWQTQPDAVMLADGSVMAARGAAGVVVAEGERANGFGTALPAKLWGTAGEHSRACRDVSCDVMAKAGVIRLLTDGQPRCEGARLVLAAMPLRGACAGVAVADRFTVYREGAMAFYLTPGASGVRAVSDRDVRGGRPWAVFAQARPRLPPAPTE